MEDNNCVNDTIEINWEDAPEGTTHYEPKTNGTYSHFWNKLEKDVWYYYKCGAWVGYSYLDQVEADFESFIPKPEQPTEATYTEDSYTDPKADPFAASLNKTSPSQISLADYLESIISNVEQGPKPFVVDMTAPVEQQGGDLLDFLFSKKETEKEDSNVSWYDYDKEELTGLPEKGEIVYDRFLQEDVEYLGKLFDEDTVILEAQEGRCYTRLITHLKPLNYKDSPTRQARKEQHKLLEDLVGDVDSNLQGYTYKAGAIELYNKGWRVSKEDV